MIEFNIEPFRGALPLRFGMAPNEVEAVIGPCDRSEIDFLECLIEDRDNINVSYSRGNHQLREVVFTSNVKVLFRGNELFRTTDLIGLLKLSDPEPKLFVGNVIFAKLGIGISGFHDNDESQKAIAVYARGYFDEYIDEFVPFE